MPSPWCPVRVRAAPQPKEGTAPVVKKVLTWGTVAFIIFFIAYKPAASVQVFRSIGSGIVAIAGGFGDFFDSLVD
jgi:hypothetical protein